MRFMAILLGAIGAAALVMGCGGGGDGDTTVSKAGFEQQANAICKRLSADAEAAMLAWSKSADENAAGEKVNAQGETASEIMGSHYEAKASSLGELTPPAAAEEQFEALLTALDKALDEGEKEPEGFISGNKSLEDVGRVSTEIGLDCAA
jgi:hypothetical protein